MNSVRCLRIDLSFRSVILDMESVFRINWSTRSFFGSTTAKGSVVKEGEKNLIRTIKGRCNGVGFFFFFFSEPRTLLRLFIVYRNVVFRFSNERTYNKIFIPYVRIDSTLFFWQRWLEDEKHRVKIIGMVSRNDIT